MITLLFVLWFFLPAGIANASPVIAAKLPILKRFDQPIDFGFKFRSKRIFGAHKTWRGLISGILMAVLIVFLQQKLWANGYVDLLDGEPMGYLGHSAWLLGFLFGFGALAGDFIESFAKRQIGIESGKSWFPFDQTDYIIGGCLAVALLIQLSAIYYLLVLVVWFGMHLLFSYIGYTLKLKNQPI